MPEEVVRVTPFSTFEILSEVTELRPDRDLAYRWSGPGMHGELAYRIEAAPGGTLLVQRQTLILTGLLRMCGPCMARSFARHIEMRLAGIQAILEGRARFGETA